MPFNIPNTTFVFVRSAQTTPTSVSHDRNRTLTPSGRLQAVRLESKLTPMIFDLALVSPAFRAFQTYQAIVGETEPPNIVILHSLYEHRVPETNQYLLRMYAELGFASYREYLQHRFSGWFADFATIAAENINNDVAMRHRDGYDVLVVGHHPHLNGIICAMFPTLTTEMLDFEFVECGAVKIAVDHHGQATFKIID